MNPRRCAPIHTPFPALSSGWGMKVVLGFLALALWAADAPAWSVHNGSSITMRARVLGGNWDVNIPPGQDAACHWSDTGCNPSGLQNAVVALQVETLNGDPRKLTLVARMEAGGDGVIVEEARPPQWTSPSGHLGLVGYRVNGDVLEEVPSGILGATTRDLHFLVTADCQYCRDGDCTETWIPAANAAATAVNQHMVSRLSTDNTIRGILYAGDLTQFAHADEIQTYLNSISGFTRFVFDGLGNHDLEYGRMGVRDLVRDRKRITARSMDGDPHYSWDWHDVHFVQLNLMPADERAPSTADLNNQHNDPMGALSFLSVDLALRVGNSGRPVILIHHYGFESFSVDGQWWTAAQRLAYWNAIAPYNVTAIFTGHLHPGPNITDSLERFISWNRPSGATGGPTSIPTFVSGAARSGAYLDVQLNNANQLRVQVRDQQGNITGTRCYVRPTPIWMAPSAPLYGRGWKDDPYDSFAAAMNAAGSRINDATCNSPVADIRVKPGSYAGAVRLATPSRLTLDGTGTARVGP